VLHSAACASAAGLRYVSDETPGITRQRSGTAFRYRHPDGRVVRERRTLARIRAIAIPPAWTEVWICSRDDGHVQATGRDARRRKQYRYHPRWREVRDETKFGRMAAFARALPRIRRRAREDLARPGLPREKALAAVVHLLERTRIRVGNAEYARENDSFGLTTLRGHQVRVRGQRLDFRFRGKSGVLHEVALSDPRLAALVRRMQDLPGEELFQYIDEHGETRRVESADVNAYLQSIAGEAFTSKDFRTWAGTLLAARALRALGPCATPAEGRRNVNRAIEAVAAELRNTKAVCRKCYVHPAVIEAYLEGRLPPARGTEEAALQRLLERAAAREADRARSSGAGGRSLAPVLRRSLALARQARGLRRVNGMARAQRMS